MNFFEEWAEENGLDYRDDGVFEQWQEWCHEFN